MSILKKKVYKVTIAKNKQKNKGSADKLWRDTDKTNGGKNPRSKNHTEKYL